VRFASPKHTRPTDLEGTLIAVIEMSLASWLLAARIPGISLQSTENGATKPVRQLHARKHNGN